MDRMVFAVAAALIGSIALAEPPAAPAPPVVPGALRAPEGEDVLRGQVLLSELNCVSCHATTAPLLLEGVRLAPDLARVGERTNPHYLKRYIADPAAVKPGTTMPNVMTGMSASEREASAEAITHYLLSLTESRFEPTAPDPVAYARGEKLFHEVGCVACHNPRDGQAAEQPIAGSAPLGALEGKYEMAGLTALLKNPLEARPSARMPSLGLNHWAAHDIASYLLQNTRTGGALKYTLFVSDEKLRIDKLAGKERTAGVVDELSIEPFVQRHKRRFAVVFEGYLRIEQAGQYTFTLSADDVGRVTIGDELVLEAEGGAETGKATATLKAGLHAFRAAYVQDVDAAKFELTMKGPGDAASRPIAATMLTHTREAVEAFAAVTVDDALAAKGKALFATLGCAACHALEGVEHEGVQPEMAELDVGVESGCLSGKAGAWAQYPLSAEQVRSLRAALATKPAKATDEQRITHAMLALNCVACHSRGDLGGIPSPRNVYFKTEDLNLGEAARIPPTLTGVGAKLKRDWMRRVIEYGESVRPYMNTRMPAFGPVVAERLVDPLGRVDTVPALAPLAAMDRDPLNKLRNQGRELVGTKGLNCIACHAFRGQAASPLEAVDLVTTTERLNRDWLYEYMKFPQRFNALTIMPSFWPGGQSVRKDILEGDADKQLEAIWRYLDLGADAGLPQGIAREPMQIVVEDEAVMLRRQYPDIGKRGIGVGYPSGVNLTFDAEQIGVVHLWKGDFVDAGGVWRGQGSGSLRLLGENRIELARGSSLALLDDPAADWPEATARERDVRFKGYRLDAMRRPTFLYRVGEISVQDMILDEKDAKTGEVFFRRVLIIDSPHDAKRLVLRAASGKKIETPSDGVYSIDGKLKLTVAGAHVGKGVVAEGEKLHELRLPIDLTRGVNTLILEYRW